MGYKILSIANSDQLLICDADDTTNTIRLGSVRDLLLLRSRIANYVDNPQPDGTLHTAPTPNNEMISSEQAQREAAAQGHSILNSTLRMAITQGRIPGAEKRGGRWWFPHRSFDAWLENHLRRK